MTQIEILRLGDAVDNHMSVNFFGFNVNSIDCPLRRYSRHWFRVQRDDFSFIGKYSIDTAIDDRNPKYYVSSETLEYSKPGTHEYVTQSNKETLDSLNRHYFVVPNGGKSTVVIHFPHASGGKSLLIKLRPAPVPIRLVTLSMVFDDIPKDVRTR